MKIDALLIVDGDVFRSLLPFISVSESRGRSGEAARRVVYFSINRLADTCDKFSPLQDRPARKLNSSDETRRAIKTAGEILRFR